jgi:flagellar hook-basal body complex protein FliE
MASPVAPVGPYINPETRPAPIAPQLQREPAAAPDKAGAASKVKFADLLEQAVRTEASAQKAAETYAAGKSQHMHETMIALTKAEISFSLLVSVRNKLMDAYREVMRMH